MALDSDAALFWASELTEHNVCRNALEMKQLVALLLTNEMRNYGDTKHADPPDRWLFAERVPSEVLQRLGHRLRGHYVAPTYVAPTAKKRARQISRCDPFSGALCLFIRLRVQFVQVADKGHRRCSAEEVCVYLVILRSCMSVARLLHLRASGLSCSI